SSSGVRPHGTGAPAGGGEAAQPFWYFRGSSFGHVQVFANEHRPVTFPRHDHRKRAVFPRGRDPTTRELAPPCHRRQEQPLEDFEAVERPMMSSPGKEVLRLHYGLLDRRPWAQGEVGKGLGLHLVRGCGITRRGPWRSCGLPRSRGRSESTSL